MLRPQTKVRNPQRVSQPVSAIFNFTPLSLKPVVWFDAADTSTITASSNAVSQWNDKSGNGRNITQATSAWQPKSGTKTRNGLNVIEFDGANNQQLKTASFTWNGTAHTWFYVLQIASSDTEFTLAAFDSGSYYAGAAASGSTSTQLSVSVTTASTDINGVRFTGTTRGNLYTAVGTNLVISRQVNTTSQTGVAVGYEGANYNFGNGTVVCELCIVPETTTQQTIAMENYLKRKWGIVY